MEMTIQEAIEARHSVRAYKEQPLTAEVVKTLEDKVAELNREGHLHMQLVLNEPRKDSGCWMSDDPDDWCSYSDYSSK